MLKYFICLLYTIFVLSIDVQSQEKDSLIQLYPGLGDTIDQFDREYFGLFQNIHGFESAMFFIRDNEKLLSKVTYTESGKQKDTIFIQQLWALKDARERIKKIEVENDLKLETENEAIVFLKDQNIISGRLIMFNKHCIFIVTEDEVGNPELNYIKIQLENIDQIKILGASKTLSYGGIGAVAGLLLLPINALVGGWAYATIWVFNPIVCGIIGLVVGALSARYEDIYIVETNYDILELKNIIKYQFKNDESVKELYKEIE